MTREEKQQAALQASLAELPTLIADWSEAERLEVARFVEYQAACLVRIAAYLDARSGWGCGDLGHAAAVQEQNKMARKVRKAQGYSRTPDIHF